MLGAIKNIIQMINVESANIAGANVTGYKKKEAFLGSSGTEPNSIGNDLYTRTNNSQGSSISTDSKTDLAIQGKGFFVLFNDGISSSINPNEKLANLAKFNKLAQSVTNGTFTVNGNLVAVNPNTDSLNDVLGKIKTATGNQVIGSYDPVQNAVTLTNTTGIPSSTITFGATQTTNFLSVMQLNNSKVQKGSSNNNYITSNNPVGIPNEQRTLFYTRKGDFHFDNNGFLVNGNGLFVGGIDKRTGEVEKIDKKTFDGAGSSFDDVHFTNNGILFNDSQLGKQGKQIALAKFPNENGLYASQFGGDVLLANEHAGVRSIGEPDTNSFGVLDERSLEASNANVVESLTNLGVLQKFFPSTMSALKVAMSVQDDLNNEIK